MLLQIMYTILVYGQILIGLLLVVKTLCKIKTYAFLFPFSTAYVYDCVYCMFDFAKSF